MTTPPEATGPHAEFARDVRDGLTGDRKAIPPRWLYDRRGSQLFEQITELPEYYLTRAERGLLQDHAAEIAHACPAPVEVVEFGAGSASKTRIILDAVIKRQGATVFCPIDISPKAITMAQQELSQAFPGHLTIRPVLGTYEEGLGKLEEAPGLARLVLFIGSSIGNFPLDDQAALLGSVAQAMGGSDRFLLGTDMAKDRATLEAAYDDSQGVTARFTKNLLARMNRELGAGFDPDAFAHRAIYNPDEDRVEIYLESLVDQTVTLEALDLEVTFQEGELLHTEHSYKYTRELLTDLFGQAGLALERSWYDEKGWFGIHLLSPAP